MSGRGWIVGQMSVGGDDVEVQHVASTRKEARDLRRGWSVVMPVYYRAKTTEPRVGDRLGTWLHGSTRYAVAS